jgi:hypothetical protein
MFLSCLILLFVVGAWAHEDPVVQEVPNTVLGNSEEARAQATLYMYVNISSWHKDLFNAGVETACAEVLEKYANQSWENLSGDAMNEMTHCLVRESWLKTRHENDSFTCDLLMREYGNWSDIDVLTKRTLSKCATDYIVAATARQIKGLGWIPLDFLTNPMRKWLLLADMGVKLEGVFDQHKQDQALSLDRLLDPEYQKKWVERGFYVGHYAKIIDEPSLAFFRETHNLSSYISWNFDTEFDLEEFFKLMYKELDPAARRIIIDALEMLASGIRFNRDWRKFDDRMHEFFKVGAQ